MGSRPSFAAAVESRNGVTSVALRGELDLATLSILNGQLDILEQDRDGSEVIMLDLRDLSFVDSSGLRAILAANERSEANGHRLLLVGANRTVRRVFEVTGTESLLDDEESADVLERFSGEGERRQNIVARAPTRLGEALVSVDKYSGIRVEHLEGRLLIEVARIPGRSNLRMCRARAKVVAAREGFHSEPEVAPFHDELSTRPYPRSPRGWVFAFEEDQPA